MYKFILVLVMCMGVVLPLHSYSYPRSDIHVIAEKDPTDIKDPHCEGHQEGKPHRHGPECQGSDNQNKLREGLPALPKMKPQFPGMSAIKNCTWVRFNQGQNINIPAKELLNGLAKSPQSIDIISDNFVVVKNEAYKKSIYKRAFAHSPDISILYEDLTDVIIEVKWHSRDNKNYYWNNKLYENDMEEPYAQSRCNEL